MKRSSGDLYTIAAKVVVPDALWLVHEPVRRARLAITGGQCWESLGSLGKIVMRRMLFLLFLVLAAVPVRAAEENVLFLESFHDLENWRPLFFPKIPKHTLYTVETEGDRHYLRLESHASASALVYQKAFNVYDYPHVRWRWKVDNVYKNWDGRTKRGDDYPIRVYILFKYDPDTAGFLEKVKYNAAKLIYGEYPPHSTLNYVWASKPFPERIITSPYTGQAKLILLEKGEDKVGKWVLEEVNIIDDYQKAFGEKPPVNASLAIMNDSDNTGESAVSYLEFIEVYR
jgi:hypothetical protein